MGVEISLSGIADLVEELERMAANSAKIQDEVLQTAAEPVLQEARRTTAFHDRSGKLRGSLNISKSKIRKGQRYVLVQADEFYGRMVEFGTSKMSARPFLQPALERNEKIVLEIIRNVLGEALGK
ncbi:MAG TPA: HK97-gp10 family putative phage morphogenesis protein [Desulfitobacteriaceae bacterium]|nr:HK97-gp10 family putative phage morphogenesis protein [Desulfitobacteriaceae bacterium]